MLRGWWTVLAAAAILGSTTAKPTTQDTLVVSRSDDESSTTTATSEVTTEEPNAPIKLTEMDIQSKISLRYAHTAVVTRVRNPAKRAQETTFRMLLPDTAFISGFTMTIDGKAYKAYVKPKEEAKQIYSDAVSQGLGAAHIAAKARDSNHFTVSVNVEPSSSVVFNLTYEELLVRRNGVYNHAVNLHPGTVVPKMKVTVHIKEAEKITELRVPEIRTGNEVDATAEDPQNSKANIVRTHDDREAIITFTPDIEEQRQLIRVYAEKSKDSLASSHRWYPEDSEEKKEKEGVLGQFVVQYDVDRSKAGEILVNDGYFVHFFAPASLPPLAKHAVFVLDTSGSMIGRKVEQLRDAMQTILAKLNPGDWFSIVEFNSYVKVHDLKEADEPASTTPNRYYYGGGMSNEPPKLVAPSPATPENIAKAKIIISRLDAGGGTDIASALNVAVDLVHHGAALDGDKQEQTEPKTDDATDNKTTKDAVSKKLEPIIIFLTDGDPTVGVTDPTRIINRLSEKNSGEQKASIFSLAFGEDADRKFLRKLSLRNEGFMRHIYEAADAALQLRDFYRTVSSPLLADVKFLYPKAQIKEGSLTKNTFRTYYAGSETVVAGRIENEATEIQPQVLAFCGVEDGAGRKKYEISPKVPVVRTSVDYYPLERLWAYLTIKQLLDEKDALIESKNDTKETKKNLEQKALDIALNYEFVTPLTSLVVVKPNATKAVNAESVDESPANEGPTAVALTSAFSYSRGPSLNGFALSAKLGGVSRSDTKSYASNSFSNSNSRFSFKSSLSAPQVGFGFARPASLYTVQTTRFGSHSTAQQQFLPHFDPASDINSAPMAAHTYGIMDFTALEEEDYTDTFSDRIVGGHMGIRGPPSSPFLAPTTRPPRPTTISPSTTIKEPSTTIKEPSTTIKEPSTAIKEPSTTIKEPSTTIKEPSTTIKEPSTSIKEPSTTTDPLEAYSLKEFPWTLPLLDRTSDALLLQINGTQVTLKLAKDVGQWSQWSGECSRATDGGEGRCVYLASCAAAHAITATIYKTTFCVLDAGYAGVCCPISKDNPPSS